MQLRPYQISLINEISAAHRAGNQGVIIVVPTGGGKTIVFVRISVSLANAGASILIVVPAVELIRQTVAKLKALDVRCGVIAASYGHNPDPGALIQVAMVQTLRTRPNAMLKRPDYIIFDECHLAAAESYRIIRDRYPDARRLGVTATPFRLDGAGFEDLASVIVPGPSIPDLQADGFLVPFRVVTIPMTRFAASKQSRHEFNKREVADAYEDRALIGDVVRYWTKEAGATASRIVFASSVEHSHKLRDEFLERGVTAEHVDGETDGIVRKAILARLESGETRVVCNYGVLTAGFDCPRVSVLSIARATASKTLWIQMAGRALRICPEVGKKSATIIDHGGNRWRHGPLGGPHHYNLAGKPRGDGVQGEDDGKTCPQCNTVVDAGSAECEHCGFVFAQERGEISIIDGQLVEVSENDKFAAGDSLLPDRAAAPAEVERKRGWVAQRALDRAESVIARLRKAS